MSFFSERERGERPRDVEAPPVSVWSGIRAEIRARVNDGSFGASYPKSCDDGGGAYATDEGPLWDALKARVPDLTHAPWWDAGDEPPSLLAAMDTIEFCWGAVGKPQRRGSEHIFFQHFHLDYDVEAGRREFREAINTIFRRNGVAFKLDAEGEIGRLPAPVVGEAVAAAVFATGDSELDQMLKAARRKFFDPDEADRREGLKKLWDAFERIKTVGPGSDKAVQAEAMIDRMCGGQSPQFREYVQSEARALSVIGNTLQIRHTETNKERVARIEHIDFLFYRMFAFLLLAIRTL
jgi:hypothetical protein